MRVARERKQEPMKNMDKNEGLYLGEISRNELEKHHNEGRNVVNIFSEEDERNHAFQVTSELTVEGLIAIFYSSTATSKTSLDRFKWLYSGANLAEWLNHPVSRLLDEHERNDWVFVQKPIKVIVGMEPKELDQFYLSFEQIVHLAIGSLPDSQTRAVTVDYFFDEECEVEGGSLTAGHGVWLRDGMTFKVDNTGRS